MLVCRTSGQRDPTRWVLRYSLLWSTGPGHVGMSSAPASNPAVGGWHFILDLGLCPSAKPQFRPRQSAQFGCLQGDLLRPVDWIKNRTPPFKLTSTTNNISWNNMKCQNLTNKPLRKSPCSSHLNIGWVRYRVLSLFFPGAEGLEWNCAPIGCNLRALQSDLVPSSCHTIGLL